MKDTLARDGATTVEAVPMTFMHNDGYVVTIDGDDFIAAGTQQGLESLTTPWKTTFARIRWAEMDQELDQWQG